MSAIIFADQAAPSPPSAGKRVIYSKADGYLYKKNSAGLEVPIDAGPSFAAYQSVLQSLVSATRTKLLFQTKEYDTHLAYDISNSRFSPGVAGIFNINAGMFVASAFATVQMYAYVNGVNKKQIGYNVGAAGAVGSVQIALLAADYLEIFAEQSAATQNTIADATVTYFQANWQRPL